MLKEKRIRATLALIRSGKIPMLKKADSFELIPLDKTKGQIAEVTHFWIDYSRATPILCLEFNAEGPRMSDLEYYFRIVARDKLQIAKGTDLEFFMDTSIDKALASFRNVLNLEIKVQPSSLSQLNTALVGQYFTSVTTLGQKINPKFVKIEALFQTKGRIKSKELNTGANQMFKALLEAFKERKQNIDVFDNFVVKYEDKDGMEETFSLLKGKKEIEKFVDLENTTERKLYELIEPDFDAFIQSLK